MQKKYLIASNIFLLCIIIIGVLIIRQLNEDVNQQISIEEEPVVSVFAPKNVIECDENLTNLFFHDNTVLIVGYSGCTPCELIQDKINLPSNLHIHAFYFDFVKSDKHKLIVQALRTSSFPTIYFIEGNCEIKSITKGLANYEQRLTSSLLSPGREMNEVFDGVAEDKVLGMLSASLKAVLALMDKNYEEVGKYAHESVNYGTYFFNNWLLYIYYMHEHKIELANQYKNQALRYIDGINSQVYADLIENL